MKQTGKALIEVDFEYEETSKLNNELTDLIVNTRNIKVTSKIVKEMIKYEQRRME